MMRNNIQGWAAGLLLIATLLTAFASQTGFAGGGGWVSSGGEIFKDAHNPWFLKNTPIVRYCVQYDPHGFSATREEAEKQLKRALKFWKEQFTQHLLLGSKDLGVGSQDFNKQDCDGTEDIRFQFGAETLTDEQLAFLKEPGDLAGIAVRTAYDPVQLRGKGFVYIASDIGPKAYDAGPDAIEKPWKYPYLLYRIIAHELGHVFGLPHNGASSESTFSVSDLSYSMADLMSAQFAENLLRKSNYSALDSELGYRSDIEIGNVFIPSTEVSSCLDPALSELFRDGFRKFFSLPKQYNCVHAKIIDSDPTFGFVTAVELFASMGPTAPRRSLGVFTSPKKDGNFRLKAQDGIEIYLNPKQSVFREEIAPGIPFLNGPMPVSFEFEARSKGFPNSVYFKLSPNHFELLGVSKGRIVILL